MADRVELSRLVQWFEDSETSTYSARLRAERDRDFYDGSQWTDEEIKELNNRKQPVVTINRIKRKVDALKGIEKQQRTDPKAFPRTPQHEDASEAATDAIRFVVENNNYDQKRSSAWENLLVEGIGCIKVSVKPKRDDFDITLSRVPWDRFFYDPMSYEPDFSDAKYMGEVIWMDLEDAKARWPDKAEHLEATLRDASLSETYDDKPKTQLWADRRRNRVRIVQIRYLHGGQWYVETFTKSAVLRGGISPFEDEDGEPDNDLIAVSAFVDRDNNRYGAVREMISPQQEINKRRSKLLHHLSVRQAWVKQGSEAGQKKREVRQELAKPDGVVETHNADDFSLLETNDMAQGQATLLQEAKGEIDLMGPNPSLQGKDDKSLSGRALLTQQQAGMVELAPLLDRKRDLDLRVYRAIWNRIRQFWTGEKWIRVTDDQRNLKFVGLNRPVTVAEQMEKEFGEIPPQVQGRPELEMIAQENGQPIIENSVAEMDVDIILDEGPDSITIQAEEFEQLATMASAGVPIPPEILVEASTLRNKDKLLEMMSGGDDPQQQQLQQALQELQLRGQEAEVRKTEAEAADEEASASEREASAIEKIAQAMLNRAEATNERQE